MKNNYVTDTMALILRLEERKLPAKVKAIFQKAENDEAQIFIPAIALAELGYLSEKKRIDTNLKSVKRYYSKYKAVIVAPLTEEIVEKSFNINDISELHDRIIAGTAYYKKLKLITNDPNISSSKFVKVVW